MRLFGWRGWLRRQRKGVRGRRRGLAARSTRPRLEALEDRLTPATLTWTGALDNLWGSTQGSGSLTNWTSSDNRAVAIPQNGDDLVFPAGAANLTNTNDISGLSVQSITFQGTGYAIGGNALTLAGALADQGTASANSLQLDLTLPGTIPLSVDDAGENLSLTGAVGGTGGITKTGAGRVTLTQNNAYGGGTDVQAGEFNIQLDAALGVGPVTVESGAALEIQANLGINPFLNITNDITLNGSGVGDTGAVRNLSGFNALGGNITLQSDTTVGADGGELSLSGPIGGAHGLTKVGVDQLNFSGSAPNTYTGPTLVNAGFVALEKDAGVVAVPGDLVIGNGTGQPTGEGFSPTTVQLETDEQIADTARVTVASDGLLDVDGFAETIGSLAGTGQLNLSNGSPGSEGVAGTLTLGADNTASAYAGVITGDGGNLTKVGGGAFALSGANSYTGITSVNGGLLLVDGSQAGSPVVVNAGGTLAGNGTAGPTTVNAGGTVAPSDSPGALTVQGGITFNPGSFFSEALNGPTAGVGYGQLNVVGSIVLNGPTLRLVLGFTPKPGQDFVLITNNGGGRVQGSFAGAPEDALLRHGSAFFDLSYVGGRGSDVDVLTVTQADLFVRALFADFDVPSNRATRAPFEGRADSGESRLNVARDFLNSPERRLGEVNQFYATFGQPPDGQQGAYLAQLLAGVAPGQVLINFIRSRSFRSVRRTNQAYVRELFTGILGRRPSRHDTLGGHSLSFYVQQLSSRSISRARLVRELLASDDVYTAAVVQNFTALLGTPPTPAQLQTLAGQLLTGGLTPDGLTASVVTLDDYVKFFLTRAGGNRVSGVVLVNV